jgi:O-antigen/teichoic acid export membrane protein
VNASYSVLENLAPPILMLFAIPFLVSHLGLEHYGIWMLVTALTGVMQVFDLGLASATVKYVSSYRGKGDTARVVLVVRSSLTLYALLGFITSVLIFSIAPMLVGTVFRIEVGDQPLAIRAIQVGAIGLGVRFVDAVFLSTLRGYERYDLSAKVMIVVKIAIVGVAVGLVALGYGVVEILVGTVVVTATGAVAQAMLCRQLLREPVFWPSTDPEALREILSFGMYSWFQGVGATVFRQADQLLVGAMLGAGAVAYYNVCLRLTQQIHSLVSAAFNFLFPLISSKYAKTGSKGLKSIFRKCLGVNVVSAACLALPILFFGNPILILWMGADFAEQSGSLLTYLSIAFFLLSINIVPYYMLLGLGQVKFVAMTNLGGGLLSIVAAAFLIPLLGVTGAAIGRMFYGPAITINYLRVVRSL